MLVFRSFCQDLAKFDPFFSFGSIQGWHSRPSHVVLVVLLADKTREHTSSTCHFGPLAGRPLSNEEKFTRMNNSAVFAKFLLTHSREENLAKNLPNPSGDPLIGHEIANRYTRKLCKSEQNEAHHWLALMAIKGWGCVTPTSRKNQEKENTLFLKTNGRRNEKPVRAQQLQVRNWSAR